MIDLLSSCEQVTNPRFAIMLKNRSFELCTVGIQESANQKEELDKIRVEHRSLDEKISELSRGKVVDHLMVRRLKKQKLQLKEQIFQQTQQGLPDIIA
ncbi:MAG: YdcH family protein [Pseudomonadota bacterium]